MAGTIVQTHSRQGLVKSVTFACTADAADGSFPSTIINLPIEGRLLALITNPGATAPTDNYDIAITDADGADVLSASGANRDTATSERVPVIYASTSLHPVIDRDDVLTLAITNNAVNSATIAIKLLWTSVL